MPSNLKITNPALVNGIQNLTGVEFLNRFLPNLITIFFVAAVIAALFFLIVGGIRWITSGGDKEAAIKAKETITAATIGLVVVFSVYAVLRLIGYFFGIDLITIDITPLILR